MKRSFPLSTACRRFARAEADEMARPTIRFAIPDHWDLHELKARGGPRMSGGTVEQS
jgi:hypothetical protein